MADADIQQPIPEAPREQFVLPSHTWLKRLLSSRYFLYALLVHGAILAVLGGRVIMRAVLPPEAFDSVDNRLLVAPATPPAPPQPKKNQTEATTDKASAAASASVASANPNKSTKVSTLAVRGATGNPMMPASPNPFADGMPRFYPWFARCRTAAPIGRASGRT